VVAIQPHTPHIDGIETEAFRRDRPLPALTLTLWLQGLTEHLR
jgi:hypothetical protein